MTEVRIPNGAWDSRAYQKPVLRYFWKQGGKRAVSVWHRRAGKDTTALHHTVRMAYERVGLYWHCLPTYRQAKKAIWDGFTADGKRILDMVFPKEIVKRKNDSEMLVELVPGKGQETGSIIQLVGSDTIDNLVGANPVGVTFSEYSISKPKAWDLVRPILRENGGWAWFIYTPRGNNHGKKLYDIAKQNPEWFCELLTYKDTGVLTDADIEAERAEGMPEALIRQEYLCDFTAANVGSVWGDLLESLEKRGGLNTFEHESDGVFTSWDLGVGDSTAIWFWRVNDSGVDFIDHYEAHGKPLSHFFDEVEGRGYRYRKHFLPHDARARTLQTGASIMDQAIQRFGAGHLEVIPALSLADGVQAVRWLLQQKTRFHPRTADGIDALRNYHYKWDEDRKVFSDKPDHDWSSHTSDAVRYAALAVKRGKLLSKPVEPKKPVVLTPPKHTLEDLYEENGLGAL